MAKVTKFKDRQNNILLPVTRATLVEMNNGDSVQIAYEGINLTHYTKDEINAAGYLTSFTETDPTVPSYVKGITETDITNWNNKADNEIYDIPTNCPNFVQEVYGGGANDGITFVNISNTALAELRDLTDISKAYSRIFTLSGLDDAQYIFVRSTCDGDSAGITSDNYINIHDRHVFCTSTINDNQSRVIFEIYEYYDYNTNANERVANTTRCTLKISNEHFITTETLYEGDFSNWNPNNLGYEFYAQSPYSTYNFVKSELNSYVSKTELNAAGYLQSFTETDPTVPSYVKGITETDITNWNNKLSEHQDLSSYVKWDESGVVDLGTVITSETQLSKGTTTGSGNAVTDISVSNHQITLTKGSTFLTSETDPIYSASAAAGITSGMITNWNSYANVKANWNETDSNSAAYIQNKPTIPAGLPTVSSTDNGKVLQVVNGEWSLVSPVTLYTGTGTPNNSQGNNGDLYMQI